MAKAPDAVVSSDQDPGTETGISSVDSKLAALDDDLNPIEDAPKTESKEPEAADSLFDDGIQTDDNPEDIADDTTTTEEAPTDDEAEEPAGYAIEESDDDENTEDTETVEPATPATTATAPEDQYILDGIKDLAITVRGVVGDSKDIKEFKVLAPEQLPAGFSFIDGRELALANKSFGMLEQKAAQLQTEYRQQQITKSNADVTARERADDRRDINALQKRGDIPLFKAQPDDPGFETDAGVELVQKVLDFKDKLNNQYASAFNSGRAYRHISFEDAFYRYQRENPTEANPAQKKEDIERKNFARRTSSAKGSSVEKTVGPKIKPGMSSQDLDRYIESLDI